jgi:hypothetical protein
MQSRAIRMKQRFRIIAPALVLALGSSLTPLAADIPVDPIVEPNLISTAAAEVRAAYSPDGRRVLWGSIGRDAAADQQDIWEIHRTESGWSTPARVSFDTDAVEFDPVFSADGHQVYFDSDRGGGFGGTDIYVVDVDPRTGGFSAPRNVGAGINSSGDEWAPTPTRKRTLIFSSDGWGGYGKHDLFEAELKADARPVNLGPHINGPDEDFDAALTPDGGSLVFSSGQMSDDAARVELYISKHSRTGWSSRSPLGIGCSDFVIGSSIDPCDPAVLLYAAKCAGGLGRMDIHRAALKPRH